MLQTSNSSGDLLYTIFDFLFSNPLSFFLIPIVWIVIIVILKELVGIYVSAWSVLMSLIVAVGVVIGIIAIFVSV